MRIVLGFTIASLLLGGAVRAETNEIEVGTAVVCDTQNQVERFVALDNGDENAAIQAVNSEAGNLAACTVASLAFVRGRDAITVRTGNATFRIAPILVIGVLTSTGVQPVVTPSVQFAPFKIDERIA